MDTNEKITFKTAFRGFEKKGVVDYIRNLSAKFDEILAAKQTEAENYKAVSEGLKEKLSTLETKVSVLEKAEAELGCAKEKIALLQSENDELKEKLKSLADVVESDYIPDKSRLEDEVERLKGELKATRCETEKNKAEIADVLIKADKLAKKLQEDAVMSANAEKAEIEKQIISKKSELLGINGEIERMKNVFQDLYTRYVDK